MGINHFFQETLGANLKNPRWSWGAVDPLTNRVFLRVWKDQIKSFDGEERVRVARKIPRSKSPGYKERLSHIDTIRNGAEGIGVVCRAVDVTTNETREIADFESSALLRFGELTEDDRYVFAQIKAWVPINKITRSRTAHSTLVNDIRTIIGKRNIESTDKEALVNARVGQGTFRAIVLQFWNYRCSVTGSSTLDAIRASHIKPWRDSTDEERLDPSNGLPLVASLDALFDAGLISFEASGEILVSPTLQMAERNIFGIVGKALTKKPTSDTARYLLYHHKNIFQT
ncbi:MAG: HNH endonuclease [Candidatus Anammoxibacter sp.]